MKSFTISASLTILAAFPQIAQAWYECSLSDAVPLGSLLSSSGSSGSTGGLTGGSNITPASPGCSFYIAVGGSCTTTKSKRAPNLDSNDKIPKALEKRTTYTTLPCLNSMTCVTVSGQLACFDLNSYDFIDDQGTCGNANSAATEPGCVAAFLAEQSSSTSATSATATATATVSGVKTTAMSTASGVGSTAPSASAQGRVTSSNGGARLAAVSILGWSVLVVGLVVV